MTHFVMSFCRIWYKLAVVFCNKVFLLTKPEVATTADYQKPISLSLVPPSYAMPKVRQFFDFRGSLYVTVPLPQGKLQDSLEFKNLKKKNICEWCSIVAHE